MATDQNNVKKKGGGERRGGENEADTLNRPNGKGSEQCAKGGREGERQREI